MLRALWCIQLQYQDKAVVYFLLIHSEAPVSAKVKTPRAMMLKEIVVIKVDVEQTDSPRFAPDKLEM